MSKKSNPTLIGAFVVGAVALLAAAAALFGGAELLAARNMYVAYFTEDAKGLREGSNVMLNGVRVGFVSDMAVIVDQDSFESKTKVTMEVMPDAYVVQRDGKELARGLRGLATYEEVVYEGGLRAVLQVESFVTGQLLVELRFRPDTEVVMRGGPNVQYPEIPTIPSQIQEMLAKVQNWVANLNEGFDAKEIGARLESVMRGLDELMNSADVRESLAGLNAIINSQNTQELGVTLEAALEQITVAAADASSLLQNADAKLATLDTDLKPAIESVVDVLDEASMTLAAARSQLEGESIETYQLGTTLREVEGAARALREFLDYLERNPEAILRGKKR